MTFLFDVDGVICDRGEKIDPEFKLWLTNFLKDKKFHWVTGSMREKTIHQIGQDLYDMCDLSFHSMGNEIYVHGEEVLINQFNLTSEEKDFLLTCVNESLFTQKTGLHIEQRKGSVNFSIPGRNADKNVRQQYIEYDKINSERLKLVEKIENNMPRFQAYIGGDISIDICLKNCNKGQVVFLSGSKALFFGDRMDKFGIDVPLMHMCSDSHHIKNGYKETWEILKTYDINSA